MSSRSDIIFKTCMTLAELEDLRVSIGESFKGAAIVGVGAFIGGLLGGPEGFSQGAILGSQAARSSGSEFKSAVEILGGMSKLEREQLVKSVGSLLDDLSITNAGAVVASIVANRYLMNKVVEVIQNFCAQLQ